MHRLKNARYLPVDEHMAKRHRCDKREHVQCAFVLGGFRRKCEGQRPSEASETRRGHAGREEGKSRGPDTGVGFARGTGGERASIYEQASYKNGKSGCRIGRDRRVATRDHLVSENVTTGTTERQGSIYESPSEC